jgi:hypothetical protein
VLLEENHGGCVTTPLPTQTNFTPRLSPHRAIAIAIAIAIALAIASQPIVIHRLLLQPCCVWLSYPVLSCAVLCRERLEAYGCLILIDNIM